MEQRQTNINPNTQKARIKSELFVYVGGGYWESNPDREFHKLQC